MKITSKLSRRQVLRSSAALAGALGAISLGRPGRSRAEGGDSAAGREPYFLFTITATGGGSIVDSFLPVARSEVSTPERADQVPAYPDDLLTQPAGSNIRVVQNLSSELPSPLFSSRYDPVQFLSRHGQDMLVMAVENTSVSHIVAQARSMNGDGIDRGRTISEAFATEFGAHSPLPNLVMTSGGFTEHGKFEGTEPEAQGILVGDANRFAISTHGSRGVRGAPAMDDIRAARDVRRQLESASAFAARHADSSSRRHFLRQRDRSIERLESRDAIAQLLLLSRGVEPGIAESGLVPSPQLERLLTVLPRLETDPLHAQAALAYLLVQQGLSSAVTFGPGFIPEVSGEGSVFGTPIAFDYSHTNHLTGQNVMWCRLLEAVDGLITLLKQTEHGAGSLWDRSLVYIASDFGRTKEIPAGMSVFTYSSGHDLNNGAVVLSPRVRGNRVFGGVDPDTCRTFGFDPRTGDPDPGRRIEVGHVYSLLCQAAGIDFPGRHDMSALIR